MYCVIQEIDLKKENKNGAAKELLVDCFQIGGEIKYFYFYSKDCFYRPIKKAFKISIHKSYRENKKVKKIQYILGTIHYYDLISCGWYEYLEKRIDESISFFQSDSDTIYNCIESSLENLQNRVEKEFEQTEEYKTCEKHKKIVCEYQNSKRDFAEKYHVDKIEYDFCYDVFGNLRNPAYLEEIKEKNNSWRSYYENKQSNYSDYSDFFKQYSQGSGSKSSGSYSILKNSNYTEEEKSYLKKFYKLLSVKYHPDNNLQNSTDLEMKLLNKLKQEWNI